MRIDRNILMIQVVYFFYTCECERGARAPLVTVRSNTGFMKNTMCDNLQFTCTCLKLMGEDKMHYAFTFRKMA